MNHLWSHVFRGLLEDKKYAKWTAVALIVLGFFLAPVLIGIPMIIFGVIKLWLAYQGEN